MGTVLITSLFPGGESSCAIIIAFQTRVSNCDDLDALEAGRKGKEKEFHVSSRLPFITRTAT